MSYFDILCADAEHLSDYSASPLRYICTLRSLVVSCSLCHDMLVTNQYILYLNYHLALFILNHNINRAFAAPQMQRHLNRILYIYIYLSLIIL